MISVPVLPISDAKLCNRPRKALHVLPQSFACAYAKHCSYWMNQVAYLIIYI